MKFSEVVIALLIAMVIAGAFYAGLSTDFTTFLAGANRFVLTLQGRTQSGQFPSYPGNAPAVPAASFSN